MTTFTTNPITQSATQPSVLRVFARRIAAKFLELRIRYANAAALSGVRERDLKDIGLTKNDIASANGLPLSIDAATTLRITSLYRSGDW